MNPTARPIATLRDLPGAGRWFLAAICLFGILLRVWYQVGRPFIGDEVGTLLHIRKTYGYLLTHFEQWLTMNVYIVLIKFLSALSGDQEWVLVAPSLICGIAAIPLTAAIAVRVTSPATALLAALLVAGNPYLILYSVQIRSYILLLACSLACFVVFLDWCARPGWGRGTLCAGFACMALLMHANAIYFLIFLALLLMFWIRNQEKPRWSAGAVKSILSLAVPMFVGVAVAAATYVPLLETMRDFRATWSDTPPTSLTYVPFVFASYFGRGFFLVPSLVLTAYGLWVALRRNRRLALLAWGVAVPVATASLLGVSHYPWAYARFFITVVPLLIVFIAEGVVTLPRRRPSLVQGALAMLVLLSWVPDFHRMVADKTLYPWPKVAEHLLREAEPTDRLLTLDDRRLFTAVNLGIHLGDNYRHLTTIEKYLSDEAGSDGRQQLFVVGGGEPATDTDDMQTFGNLYVLNYAGTNRHQIANRLLDDLRARLDPKGIDAKLTDHYQAAGQLMTALSRWDGYSEYVRRYHECLKSDNRHKRRPPQQRDLNGRSNTDRSNVRTGGELDGPNHAGD